MEDAAHQPVALEALSVQWVPFAVRLGSFAMGEEPARSVVIENLVLQLHAAASLSELRPVLSMSVASIVVDATQWPTAEEAGGDDEGGTDGVPPLPPLRLEPVSVGSVQVTVPSGEVPTRIEASGVTASAVTGPTGLRIGVRARESTVRRGAAVAAVSEFSIEGGADGGGVLLRDARLRSDIATLQATGEARDAVAVRADADLARLMPFIDPASSVRGKLSLSATVRGLARPEIDGVVRVDDPAYGPRRADHIEVKGRLKGRKVDIADALLRVAGSEVGARGTVTIDPPYAVSGEVSTPSMDLETGGAALGIRGFAGTWDGTAVFDGTAAPLSGHARGTVGFRSLRQHAFSGRGLDGVVTLDGRVAEGASHVDVAVRVGDEPVLAAVVDVSPGRDLDGTVALAVQRAEVLAPVLPELGGGTVVIQSTLGGDVRRPILRGQVVASDAIVFQTKIDGLRATVRADTEAMVVSEAELVLAGGRAAVDGRFALGRGESNDWKAAVENLELGLVRVFASRLGRGIPQVKGVVDGEVRASGPWSELVLDAGLRARKLDIEAERLETLQAQLRLQQGRWEANLALERTAAETLRIQASGTGLEQLSATVRSTPWALDRFGMFKKRLPDLGGSVTLTADVSGRWASPAGSLVLSAEEVVVDRSAVGAVTARVASVPQGWALTVETPGNGLAATATIRDERGYPFTLDASARDLDLAVVVAPDAGLAARLDGALSAGGSLADPLGTVDGALTIPRLMISRGTDTLRNRRPVVIRGRNGRFEIADLELEGDLGSLRVSGSAGADGAVAVQVAIDAEAGILELAGRVATSASGRLRLAARIERIPGAPWDLEGRGDIENLAIDFGLPFGFTDTSGAVTLRGDKILLDAFSGRVGGGEFTLEGMVDLTQGPDLRWQFSEVGTGLLRDLEDRISGRGVLRGTWKAPEVAGVIKIVSMLYDRNIGLADLVPSFRRQVSPPRRSDGGTPIALDLTVDAPDGIFVDTPFAKAEFRADLTVRGTSNRPRIDGRIEALSGEITVGRSVLELEEGVIDFNNRRKINPDLNFTAATDVRAGTSTYRVAARVTGTLNDFRVALTADDPGLTETDIVSLLTVGKTAAQMQGEGGGVGVGDVLGLAPSLYGRQMGGGITSVLPIDRIEVAPAFSPATGSFEPRLTIGKDLTERFQASVTTTLAARSRNKVLLDYQLTPRLLVEGTWESRTEASEGSFGANVKFRRQFRGLPCVSLWRTCTPGMRPGR